MLNLFQIESSAKLALSWAITCLIMVFFNDDVFLMRSHFMSIMTSICASDRSGTRKWQWARLPGTKKRLKEALFVI
jgi:hypothetical protein